MSNDEEIKSIGAKYECSKNTMREELSVYWYQMLIFVSLRYFPAKMIPADSQLVTMTQLIKRGWLFM